MTCFSFSSVFVALSYCDTRTTTELREGKGAIYVQCEVREVTGEEEREESCGRGKDDHVVILVWG